MKTAKMFVKRVLSTRYTFELILTLVNLALFFYVMVIYPSARDRPCLPAEEKNTKDTKGTKEISGLIRRDVESEKILLNQTVIRRNMGKCNHVYGKVTIFVAVEAVAYNTLYKLAMDSLRCYIASTDYELKIVDVFNDTRVNARCAAHHSIYFRKHCAVRTYLEDTDWMMVMDADTGIVNPNHCIEEYIDPRVDMVFYERFFNWEIMAGNYLVKNSDFSKDYLTRWANYEFLELGGGWWKGFDNGAVHIVFLESVLPLESQEVKNCHNIWYTSKGYETYIAYVVCVRFYLGSTRIWPNKLKLMRRGHAFCRDWYHSGDAWCEKDFMIHGWKAQHVGEKGWESPFAQDFDLSKCGSNYNGWPWRPQKRVNCSEIKRMFAGAERSSADALPKEFIVVPFLNQSDIGECYPDCDIRERVGT